MKKAKIVKVFIGSPSDTINERNKISEIIEELNQTIGYYSDILVQSIMWENNVRPTIGLDGQDVINSQTQDYDIFVGMMWKKYGSPTPRAGSATDEEYSHALKSFRSNGHCKDIIFMFSKMPFNIYEVEPDQLAKVQTFRKRIEEDGVLHKDYDSIDDFAKQLKVALYQSITKLEQTSYTKEQNVPKPIRLEKIDEKTKLVFDTLSISPAVKKTKSLQDLFKPDSRIIFTGRIPRNQAESLIGSANIFLVPSRREGCPMAMIEAMRVGCIIIASDFKNACQEMVEDSVNGYVIPHNNVQAFVDRITDIIKHHDKYLPMYDACYINYCNRFSFSPWQKQMTDVIGANVLNHRKRTSELIVKKYNKDLKWLIRRQKYNKVHMLIFETLKSAIPFYIYNLKR